MPHLQSEIWEVYEPLGAKALAISSSVIGDEDPVALAHYVEGMGLTMPVLFDDGGQVFEDYAIAAINNFTPYPREFVVDAEGRVVYAASAVDTEAMAAVLDELLQ